MLTRDNALRGRTTGPSLDHDSAQWPYDIAGICFALYGLAGIGYGSLRRGAMERALAEGRFPDPPRHAHAALALSGVADFRLEDVWALPTLGGPGDFPRAG